MQTTLKHIENHFLYLYSNIRLLNNASNITHEMRWVKLENYSIGSVAAVNIISICLLHFVYVFVCVSVVCRQNIVYSCK